jgi:hypothetical protein
MYNDPFVDFATWPCTEDSRVHCACYDDGKKVVHMKALRYVLKIDTSKEMHSITSSC